MLQESSFVSQFKQYYLADEWDVKQFIQLPWMENGETQIVLDVDAAFTFATNEDLGSVDFSGLRRLQF